MKLKLNVNAATKKPVIASDDHNLGPDVNLILNSKISSATHENALNDQQESVSNQLESSQQCNENISNNYNDCNQESILIHADVKLSQSTNPVKNNDEGTIDYDVSLKLTKKSSNNLLIEESLRLSHNNSSEKMDENTKVFHRSNIECSVQDINTNVLVNKIVSKKKFNIAKALIKTHKPVSTLPIKDGCNVTDSSEVNNINKEILSESSPILSKKVNNNNNVTESASLAGEDQSNIVSTPIQKQIETNKSVQYPKVSGKKNKFNVKNATHKEPVLGVSSPSFEVTYTDKINDAFANSIVDSPSIIQESNKTANSVMIEQENDIIDDISTIKNHINAEFKNSVKSPQKNISEVQGQDNESNRTSRNVTIGQEDEIVNDICTKKKFNHINAVFKDSIKSPQKNFFKVHEGVNMPLTNDQSDAHSVSSLSSINTQRKKEKLFIIKNLSLVPLDDTLDTSKLSLKELINLCAKEPPPKSRLDNKKTKKENDSCSVTSSIPEVKEIPSEPMKAYRIDVDGNIVANTSTAEKKAFQVDGFENMDVVVEDGACINSTYRSFRKPKLSGKRWTQLETENFYKALFMVGTNFQNMEAIFEGRSRNDLKRKFQVEQKLKPERIAYVLTNPQPYNLNTIKFDSHITEVKSRKDALKNIIRGVGSGRRKRESDSLSSIDSCASSVGPPKVKRRKFSLNPLENGLDMSDGDLPSYLQ